MTITEQMIERAAHALWGARNPDTPLSSLDDYEREAAWANTLADAEAALTAALVGMEAPDA